jgi:PBP1b-binding outer membrane lipoprotein LpoB
MEKKIIIVLTLILIGIGLSSCVSEQPTQADSVQQEKSKQVVNDKTDSSEPTGVQNVPNIVNALTCMFSPDTCEATKQEQKMDR